MCITDYFKLLSCSCAIKTLNLKFLTESLYNIMAAKMIDKLEIAYVFLRIIQCHCRIGCEEKVEEENLDSGMVAGAERKRSL